MMIITSILNRTIWDYVSHETPFLPSVAVKRTATDGELYRH